MHQNLVPGEIPPPQALIRTIEQLLARQDRVILAIDGNCTAGKSTLADQLERHFACNVVHMDDFFLRRLQRTPERFREPGGNVDYERFREEVLLPLKSGGPFSYRPFDCGTMALADPVDVTPKKLTVVEGTYSHHPFFGEAYDLKIFLSVTPQLQRQRVLKRPEFLHKRFFEEWIPMENTYFAEFRIREQSDLVCEMA